MYYDFDRIKMYIVGIGIALTVLMSLWFQTEKKKASEDVKDLRGGIKWTAEAAENAVKDFKTSLTEASNALSEHKYKQASKIYTEAASKISGWSMNHGYRTLESGTTISEKHEALVKDFHSSAVSNAAEILIGRLFLGEGCYDDYRTIANGFDYRYRYQTEKMFKSSMKDISEARAKLAKNWVRLQISSNYKYYEAIARDAFTSSWPDEAAFQLVHGRPFGAAENRSTLKTMTVHIKEETARYESSEKNTYRGTAEIPCKLVVSFSMQNSRTSPSIASSWDKLPPIEIEETLPEEYFFRFKNSRQRADFEREIRTSRDNLGGKLKSALGDIPAFSTTEI